MAIMRTLVAAALGLLAHSVSAEYIEGEFEIKSGDFDHFPMIELKKFSFGVGDGEISGALKYKTLSQQETFQKSPALLLYDDNKWADYDDNRKYPTCVDKTELSSQQIVIGDGGHVSSAVSGLINLSNVESRVRDDSDTGMTTFDFSWKITHAERAHGWYLVAADCGLEQYQGSDTIGYKIKFMQEGGGHLSAEEDGLIWVYAVSTVLLALGGAFGAILVVRHVEETQRSVHLVVKLLTVAYMIQCAAIGAESTHLTLVQVYGSGSFFLDTLSEICEGLSGFVISFVLICLASGWTLIETQDDKHSAQSLASILRDPRRMIEGFNIVIILVIGLLITSLGLIVFNKTGDGDFRKFHDHESFAGRLLIGIRLFLGILFATSLLITLRSQRQHSHLSKDHTMESFLKSLLVVGTLYFMSFPTVVYIAEAFLPHYERHFFVESGVILIQILCMSALGYQFLAQSSVYRRLSTVWESGMLPTAGGLARPAKGVVE